MIPIKFFLIEQRRQGLNRFASPTTLKEPDGRVWRIQRAGGFPQEPGEAISRLRDDVTAASHGVEATKRLPFGVPSQSFDRSDVIRKARP